MDILVHDWQDGYTTVGEQIEILRLLEDSDALTIFEFGTFHGRTTLHLAANSLPDAHVYTLDLAGTEPALELHPAEQHYVLTNPGCLFQGRPESGKITQLRGDSARFNYLPYLDQIDFVFVDGSHAPGYVLNDSAIAFNLLRHGRGTIVWHDYGTWPGVKENVDAVARLHRCEVHSLVKSVGWVRI